MTREELEKWKDILVKEELRRRNLGGYSVEAEGLIILTAALLKVVQFLLEKPTREKK